MVLHVGYRAFALESVSGAVSGNDFVAIRLKVDLRPFGVGKI